jgi:hypothetical protein
MRNKHKKSRK